MKTLMNNPAIAERICNLDRFITNDYETVVFIKNMLFDALSARFDTAQELEDYVYQDCDPLDREETENISEGDKLWGEVRDIQGDIVAAHRG